MYHPRLKGSYYDIGFRYGSLLAKHGFQLPEIEERKIQFGLESYPDLKQFFPEVIDEIKGFAEGAKVNKEKLAGWLLSIGGFEYEAQCSIFAFQNEKETIVGRNFDSLFKFQKYTESSLICPKDKYSYISQSEIFIGREDGLNEKGLFIAMTYVNGKAPKPGINFLFTVRYVLENCASTEEAIKVIDEIPISTYNNFLVADRNGDMAVVEASPYQNVVRRPLKDSRFIGCTNQFHDAEMKTLENPGVEWSKSTERMTAINQYLMRKKHLSIEDSKEILSDKKACLCLDLRELGFGTLWSVVANLNTLDLFRSEGQPKKTNYKQDKRLQDYLTKKTKITKKGYQKMKAIQDI
jgi:predicted choloylglycine hydrolase